MGCQEGIAQAGEAQWCQAHQQPRTCLYWLSFHQVPKRSRDATSPKPSPAHYWDPSLLTLQLAEAGDGPHGPAGLPRHGASVSMLTHGMQSPRHAPPLSWGMWGAAHHSLHPQPAPHHDGPRGSQQRHRPPVRKSIHFITDPKSACGSARKTRFTRDISIFQQGEEKRGTNPTDPTHGSLVLENVWQGGREKLWVRGAPAEMGGDTSAIHHHPPKLLQGICNASRDTQTANAFHCPPSLHPLCTTRRCRRPPHLPVSPKWPNTLSAKRESGSRWESATEISWLERKEVGKATISQ